MDVVVRLQLIFCVRCVQTFERIFLFTPLVQGLHSLSVHFHISLSHFPFPDPFLSVEIS